MNLQMEARTIVNNFEAIWHYFLINLGQNVIEVHNIFLTLIILFIGIIYSRRFTKWVKLFVDLQVPDDKDASFALKKIIYYVSLFLYIILLIEFSNIPFKTFAFIGGALALGIGLGTQHLINNFIGSLIIMVERPVKLGDVIQIEDTIGTVTYIGGRCIKLTTLNNVDILIPNSKVLQNILVNWTLDDNVIGCKTEFKVAKGNADPNKILEQLLKILEAHNKIFYLAVKLEVVDDEFYIYGLNYSFHMSKDFSLSDLRHSITLSLVNAFRQYKFTITHPDMVTLKSISHFQDDK